MSKQNFFLFLGVCVNETTYASAVNLGMHSTDGVDVVAAAKAAETAEKLRLVIEVAQKIKSSCNNQLTLKDQCFSSLGLGLGFDNCKRAVDECKKEIVDEADQLKESCGRGEVSLAPHCFSRGLIDYGECKSAVDECKKKKLEIVNEAGSLQESCANGKGLGLALKDACFSGGLIDYGECKSAVDECKLKIKDEADQEIMDEAQKLEEEEEEEE